MRFAQSKLVIERELCALHVPAHALPLASMKSLELLGSSVAVLLTACTAGGGDKPPVFGGEGAQIGSASETPLAQAGSESDAEAEAADGPCAKPAPVSDRLEVDDFEDADSKIFKVFEREGWWYTATDGTAGEQVFPEKGTFAPVPLPQDEASSDNEYAAHLTAAGQTDWGAVWGTTLKWVRKGVGCPFNASAFSGFEFRAKGPATLWVNFPTPDTTPKENGGKCREECWDSYGKLVRIKEGWNHYQIRWNQLQQEGWGTDARFDLERLMNINFSAKTSALPADVWIDDLRFLPADAAVETPNAAPAPTPSAASASVPATPAAPVPARAHKGD